MLFRICQIREEGSYVSRLFSCCLQESLSNYLQEMDVGSDHSDHASVWILPDNEGTCLACLLQTLLDPGLSCIKRKVYLSALLGVFNQPGVVGHIISNVGPESSGNIVSVLIDILKFDDDTVASMSIEACCLLLLQWQSEDILYASINKIIEECQQMSNTEECILSNIMLLDRLITTIPTLAVAVIKGWGSFVASLCDRMLGSTPSLQTVISNLLRLLYDPAVQPDIESEASQLVCRTLICLLHSAQDESLQASLLALARQLIEPGLLTDALMLLNVDGSTLLSGLKHTLLCRKSPVQIAATQCIHAILMVSQDYSTSLMENDLAEFLFEALNTRHENQIKCIFQCLQLMSETAQFYSGCHSIYGLESIVRAIQICFGFRNPGTTVIGFSLLTQLCQRQSTSVPLLQGTGSAEECLALVVCGIKHSNHNVMASALETLNSVLRKEQLPDPLPFKALQSTLSEVSENVCSHINRSFLVIDGKRLPKRSNSKEKSAERYLELLFGIMRKACSLSPVRAVNEGSVNSSQQQHCVDVTMFHQFILHICDQHCIPVAMAHWSRLADPGIYTSFIQLLMDIYGLHPHSQIELTVKLVHVGALHLLLNLKSSHRSHLVLSEVVSSFVLLLFKCLYSVHHSMADRVPDYVPEGLKMMPDSLLVVLERADLSYDGSLVHFLVDVVYFSQIYDSRSVHLTHIPKILELCLLLAPRELPGPTLQHIVHLTASCRQQTSLSVQSTSRLLEMLSAADISSWFTSEYVVLQWIFTQKDINQQLANSIVERWLQNSDLSTLSDEDEYMSTMLKTDFIDVLLNILEKATEDLIIKTVQLMNHLVQQMSNDENCCLELRSYVKGRLLDVLQKLFITQAGPMGSHVEGILYLLGAIRHMGVHRQTDVTCSLQLLHHVVNHFARKVDLMSSLASCSLEFIVDVLTQGSDPRALSILQQNSHFIDKLTLCIESPRSEMCILSHQIVTFFIVNKSLSESDERCYVVLHMDAECRRLRNGVCEEVTSILQMLTALLSNGFTSKGIVRFDRKNQDLFQQDAKHCSTIRELRVLLIHLQQCMLQQTCDLHVLARGCSEKLIQYIQMFHPETVDHFTNQPWMNFAKKPYEESKMAEDAHAESKVVVGTQS